jgi:hypothetical protein
MAAKRCMGKKGATVEEAGVRANRRLLNLEDE